MLVALFVYDCLCGSCWWLAVVALRCCFALVSVSLTKFNNLKCCFGAYLGVLLLKMCVLWTAFH